MTGEVKKTPTEELKEATKEIKSLSRKLERKEEKLTESRASIEAFTIELKEKKDKIAELESSLKDRDIQIESFESTESPLNPTIVLSGIGADASLMEISTRMWERNLVESCDIVVIGRDIVIEEDSASPEELMKSSLAAAIASDRVSESFIFAPVALMPISEITLSELMTECEFEGYWGEKYPRYLDKETLAAAMTKDSEELLLKRASRYRGIPLPLPRMIQVENDNPDPERVKAALKRNKYLYVENIKGFRNISELL